jgi:hypothetical protein
MPSIPQTAEVNPDDIRSFDLIPPGWYNAELVDAEVRTAKSGNGEYLSLQFSLLDAPHVNRRVFVSLNLWNSNSEAVRIANQQRFELLTALGKPNAQDTAELMGIPVALRLAVKEDKSGMYEPRNEVKGFRAVSGAAPRPMSSAPAARPAAPAAKPWQRATA